MLYRAEFFDLIHLTNLNLTKMPVLVVEFNFYVKLNVQ